MTWGLFPMFHDAKFGCRIGAFLGLAVWTMSSGAALGQTVQREYLAHPDNDKEKIELFWTKPDGPGPWPAVVFIHGHQTNRIGGMVYVEVGRLRRTVERGFVAAAVSQPGYGNSSGPPDFSGPFSQSAVLKAIEFLRAKPFVKPDKIGLVGGSRGAIVASMVATKDSRLAALVLVSGIYDLEKGYPTGLSGLDDNIAKEAGTSKAAFRARSAMHHADKIRMPVLLLHGADDWFDFQLVERFAEMLKANGTWVRLKVFADTGHLIPYDKQYEEIYPFLEWHLRSANIEVKRDAEPPKPQILTPRPIKEILRAKGLAEPQVKPTSVDYALLIGRWEGDFVSKTLENHVAWESKLTLDVFKNGRGRFSAAKRNEKWSTIVKIERGVVILRLYRRDVEFVYTQNDDTATLSATYEDKFKGYPRIRYVTLKKRVAPSQ